MGEIAFRRGRRAAYAGLSAGVITLGAFGPGVSATQGTSQLLVSTTSSLAGAGTNVSVQVDLSGVDMATVSAGLDNNCPNVFVDPSGHGQKYGIDTTWNPTGVASVSPTAPAGLVCTSVTAFTITGVSVGTTTLSLQPQAKHPGLQRNLSNTPATVDVTVIDSGGGGCETDCEPPPAENPAAPAVANMVLRNHDYQASTACKVAFPYPNWRGRTIRAITKVMPRPESVKDTMDFATWEQQVLNMLGTVCKYGPETVH